MAITDINISEKQELDVGAPSIKYIGNMDPNICKWLPSQVGKMTGKIYIMIIK